MPDGKLPIPQFAAKIKAKYPEYKDINDTLLVNKIVEKYPEYKDHVDLSGIETPEKKNFLSQAGSILSGIKSSPSKLPLQEGISPKIDTDIGVIEDYNKQFEDVTGFNSRKLFDPVKPENGFDLNTYGKKRYEQREKEKFLEYKNIEPHINNVLAGVQYGLTNPSELKDLEDKPYGKRIVSKLANQYGGTTHEEIANNIKIANREQGVKLAEENENRLVQDIGSLNDNYVVKKISVSGGTGGAAVSENTFNLSGINPNDSKSISNAINTIKFGTYVEDKNGNRADQSELLQKLETRLKQLSSKKGIDPEIQQLFPDIDQAVQKIEYNKAIATSPYEANLAPFVTDNAFKNLNKNLEHFMQGLSYMKDYDNATYTNLVNAIKEKKEIPQAYYRQLSEIGQEITNDKVFRASGKDPSFINAETNFDYRTMEDIKNEYAQIIGERNKKEGLGNWRKLPEGTVKALGKDLEYQNIVDELEKEEQTKFFGAIPKRGTGQSIIKGLYHPIKGMINTAQTAFESPVETFLRTNKQEGEGGLGTLKSDEHNAWYRMIEGASGIVPFVLGTRFFGGAAKGLVSMDARVAMTAAEQAQLANTAGTVMTAYMMSYGDNYADALRKTGDPSLSSLVANINSGIEGALFAKIQQPIEVVNKMRGALKNGSNELIDFFKSAKGKTIEALKEESTPFIQRMIKGASNVLGHQLSIMELNNLSNYITESIFSPQTAEKRNIGKELIETAKSTSISMAIPAILAGFGKGRSKELTKATLNEAALNYESTMEILDKLKFDGKLSEQEYLNAKDLITLHRDNINKEFEKDKESKTILQDAFESTAKTVKQEKPIQPEPIQEQPNDHTNKILQQVNNAEYINENEIKKAEDNLYDILDKNPDAAHLIEPLILKLQDYEFTTKTETRTVTEKVPTGRTAKTKTEVKPVLEQSTGSKVTVTNPNGTKSEGVLNLENGNYVVHNENGDKVAALGEKAINDRDLKLPDESEMENPIEFDNNGNVKSVTVKTRDGKLITIQHPEKALDIAIQLRAQELGEVPDAAFNEVYDEVQKQVNVEVPKYPEKINAKPNEEVADLPKQTEVKELTVTDVNKEVGEAEKGTGEPPKPPSEELPFVDESGKNIGITHEQTAELRKEVGLPEYEKEAQTFEQWDKEAKERIEKGEMPKVVDKLEKGGIPTEVEQRMMGMYIADLASRVDKEPSTENLDNLHTAIKLSDKVGGTFAGRTLVSRKGTFVPDESLAGYFTRERDTNNDAPLTENQKSTVEKEYQDISEANKAYQAKITELEAKVSELEANKEIKKASREKKKQDYATERKQIIEDIRDKLKKARGETQATILPYAKELIAIAPDVAKLVKNLASEGILRLEEVTDKIHEVLKEHIPAITKKDVNDLIAGVYNERKPTRNELAKQLFELRQQAQLVNKLEKLNAGEEPKLEKKKIQRNQEIESLRKQINEHDLTKLSEYKSRTQSSINKIEEQLKTGDFSQPEKRPEVKLDAEAKALKDKLIELRTKREVRLMKQKYENRNAVEKTRDWLGDKLNIPRTIEASLDYSGLLRQGAVAAAAHPRTALKSVPGMFKASVSQSFFNRFMYDMRNDPMYDMMKESGLSLTDMNSPFLAAREEAFMSNTAEKIPILGKFIKGSERAYVYVLDRMRFDLFKRFAERYEAEGKTYENSPKLYKATAKLINDETGRGDLGKALETAAPILNSVFFSPRLIASRVNLLTNWANPRWYRNTPKEVRVMYMKDMLKFIGLGMSILGAAKLAGANVEDDPRSSDFGKIKEGNTRWDIWGGFQPYIRLMAQMALGQKKSTITGEVQNLDERGRFGEGRGDVALRFLRGKLAPVPSAVVDVFNGRTVTGEKVTLNQQLEQRLTPLVYQDIKDAVKDKGVAGIFTVGLPSIFGIGTQTYGKPEKEIPRVIEHNGKKVELNKNQYDEFEKLSRNKIKIYTDRLKQSPDYKKLEGKDKNALENQVTNWAIKDAEKEFKNKYQNTFKKESNEEKREKKQEDKKMDKLKHQITNQ